MSNRLKLTCAIVGIAVGTLFINFPREGGIYSAPQTLNITDFENSLCSTANIPEGAEIPPTRVHKKGIPISAITDYYSGGYCNPPNIVSRGKVVVDFVAGTIAGVGLTLVAYRFSRRRPIKARTKT